MMSAEESRRGRETRLRAVIEFCSNVQEYGKDVYGAESTPLLADGVDVRTKEPVIWRWTGTQRERFGPPGEWIPSNLAKQQNLFRALAGLSQLTGESRFWQTAADATAYHFERFQSSCGLMRWGGHQFIDLATKEAQGKAFTNCHEFKVTYPYYSLLWQVSPANARRCMEAAWNAHILDWRMLDMNRHGAYGAYGRPVGELWDSDFADPASFFEGKGLTFINCGSDLIFTAAYLSHLSGDPAPLVWSKRLAYQYVKARHPATRLGVYQYSQPKKEENAPSAEQTYSRYGDRARNQLGPELGDIALEGNVLLARHVRVIYGNAAIVQLQLGELLGDKGSEFIEWTCEGLSAFARHGYVPTSNQVRPLMTDGTDLTGFRLARDGYYGEQGLRLEPSPANMLLFWSYALAHRLQGDRLLWATARQIARGHGLGDIGEVPGKDPEVNLETTVSDPIALFGLLEIIGEVPHGDYLDLACAVADNVVRERFQHGLFLPTGRHVNACFDSVEPLALLALEAALRGTPDSVPTYNAGMGYLHGWVDDRTRTTDDEYLYSVTA